MKNENPNALEEWARRKEPKQRAAEAKTSKCPPLLNPAGGSWSESFKETLARGQEALERSKQVNEAWERTRQSWECQQAEQRKQNREAERRNQEMRDDIHKDYLEHCQQQRQHLDDLHPRQMALLDARIKQTQATSAPVTPKPKPESKLESKLERLRFGCGLTYKQLADETGILNEKTVRDHCHGKFRPSPKNAKLYLQVFSRLLGHPIGIADLL